MGPPLVLRRGLQDPHRDKKVGRGERRRTREWSTWKVVRRLWVRRGTGVSGRKTGDQSPGLQVQGIMHDVCAGHPVHLGATPGGRPSIHEGAWAQLVVDSRCGGLLAVEDCVWREEGSWKRPAAADAAAASRTVVVECRDQAHGSESVRYRELREKVPTPRSPFLRPSLATEEDTIGPACRRPLFSLQCACVPFSSSCSFLLRHPSKRFLACLMFCYFRPVLVLFSFAFSLHNFLSATCVETSCSGLSFFFCSSCAAFVFFPLISVTRWQESCLCQTSHSKKRAASDDEKHSFSCRGSDLMTCHGMLGVLCILSLEP